VSAARASALAQVPAWCGTCGESFRLAELTEQGAAGRCPRCGYALAPSYVAVLDTAVRQLLAAAADLAEGGRVLRETAPRLHVDTRALCAALEKVLDR